MKNKFYTVKKTIGGVEYTAQFSGVSTALRALDESYVDGTNNTSTTKMTKFLLDNIIVEPKGLTPDDFESVEALGEITKFAREVMNGDFRGQTNESADKGKNKE